MLAAAIDEYLADLSDNDQREALRLLCDQIRAAAPDATETISYGRPAFKVDGRWLVGFSATTKHCSFYAGAGPLQTHAEQLAGYQLGKGTINFPPDRPLPPDLVAELVHDALLSRAR